MADADSQNDTPTGEEQHAAAGAEDYEGEPISDAEFAEVWEAPSARGESGSDPNRSGGDMAGGDQAGTGGGGKV
jgi:hypothetical protein